MGTVNYALTILCSCFKTSHSTDCKMSHLLKIQFYAAFFILSVKDRKGSTCGSHDVIKGHFISEQLNSTGLVISFLASLTTLTELN